MIEVAGTARASPDVSGSDVPWNPHNIAAAEFHLDLERSWMVGDSWKDVEAARAAASLAEAAKVILGDMRKRKVDSG